MEVFIVFNDCKCKIIIQGECTSGNFISKSICNSPKNNFVSQLNPFVLYGDNLCICIAPNESCNENLIALHNCSTHCIKFEWHEYYGDDFPYEIRFENRTGFLKGGFTKLFRVLIKSMGCSIQMQSILIKCTIYRHSNESFREFKMPDGYFEITEKGFYEKVARKLIFCCIIIT